MKFTFQVITCFILATFINQNGIEGRARREDKELAFEDKDTNEIIDRICGKRNRLTNTGTNRAIYDLMHGILKDLQQSAQRNLKRAREKAAKQTTMVNKEEKSTSSGPDQNKQFTDSVSDGWLSMA